LKANRKFLSTTRGRILGMLRETKRTVSEMARALRITETGVRLHLNALEQDGLVQQAGVLQGTRKPFHAYELTKDGEQLFPKAYGPLLAELLEVLSEKLTEKELVAACEETGRRLAAKLAPDHDRGTLERRIALALEVLTSMGGAATLAEESEAFIISGTSCPIAEAVQGSPHACQVAQSLLAEITGASVSENCEKSSKPRCCFSVARA
jgi:predicted ArsR family transcriptional regulator